jgi:thiol-disulfide isomerase/thioredoxin
MSITKAIIILAIGLLLGYDVTAQTEAKPVTLPESVLNAELASVDGSSHFRLADYSGKVLVLYIWASWCGPCRLSSPAINGFHKEYAGRGVEVIGLVVGDAKSEARETLAFTRKFEHEFQSGWMDKATTEGLMGDSNNYRNGVIPQFLVITSYGYFFKRIVGYHPKQTPELLRATVEEALSNPSLMQ